MQLFSQQVHCYLARERNSVTTLAALQHGDFQTIVTRHCFEDLVSIRVMPVC